MPIKDVIDFCKAEKGNLFNVATFEERHTQVYLQDTERKFSIKLRVRGKTKQSWVKCGPAHHLHMIFITSVPSSQPLLYSLKPLPGDKPNSTSNMPPGPQTFPPIVEDSWGKLDFLRFQCLVKWRANDSPWRALNLLRQLQSQRYRKRKSHSSPLSWSTY